MKVKQRLKINSILTAITALVILLVLLLGLNEVRKAVRASELSNSLITAFLERSTFRSDYVRTGNERAKKQWLAKHEQINLLLKSASDKLRNPEDQKTILELIKDQEITGKLFSNIVESRERPKPDASSADMAQEREDRLTAQLEMRLYDKALLVGQLHESAKNHLYSVLMQASVGITGALAVLIAAAVINTWFMNRTFMDRIRRLSKGVTVIGGGELDYKVDVIGNDEFTELSDAFNTMSS
ncbi:MAG TPA: HAMP domain-containing protein, partial [Desulfomonilia bacterium]|nr:HAMP domain-containing protein [Desulfomonilia bacterium]